MYTYHLANKWKESNIAANCIRVTNVKVDINKKFPGIPKWQNALYKMKSSFSISPSEMATTYTYLATDEALNKTTRKYWDYPKKEVQSNKWSRNKKHIDQLMQLTESYLLDTNYA